MFLSFIIPIYNDENYLEECLTSCMNQDIPYEEFEIICVDDGSTDSTPTILQRYAADYSNVIVINKKHGVGSGRNVGMEHAAGDYLWFVDHDDFIQPNCLAALKNVVKYHLADRIVFPAYSFWERFSDDEQNQFDSGELKPNYQYLDSVVWSSIIRRAFLLEHEVWPAPLRANGKPLWSADSFFISELKHAGVSEYYFEGQPLYFYRLNHRSETMQVTPEVLNGRIEKSINIAVLARDDYLLEHSQNGADAEYRAGIMMWQTKACMMRIAALPWHYFQKGVKRMKEEGLYPMQFPPEYHYAFRKSFSVDSDKTRIHNFLYYHCLIPGGKYLARAANIKQLLSKLMRSNPIIRQLRKRI